MFPNIPFLHNFFYPNNKPSVPHQKSRHLPSRNLDEHEVPDCPRAMLIQVWHGDDCRMEPALIECGEAAATAPCPLDLPNPVRVLEIVPMETAPSNGTSTGNGDGDVDRAALVTIAVFAGLIFIYLGFEVGKRWLRGGTREHPWSRVPIVQTVVVMLGNIRGGDHHRRQGERDRGTAENNETDSVDVGRELETSPPPPYQAHVDRSQESPRGTSDDRGHDQAAETSIDIRQLNTFAGGS